MSGGGSNSGGTTTTVQKSDPWIGQQGVLTKGFQRASYLLDNGIEKPYPGQTVAPLSGYSQQAVDLMAQRGLNGSPLQTAAQTEATKTLNGDYLGPDSNPWLAEIAKRNAGDITSQVQSQFGAAGRSGSGINQQVLARSIGDANNQLYGNAYNDERQRMQQQVALAPQTVGIDYTDIGNVARAGSVLDTQNQNVINADMSKWNQKQMAPWDALQRYMTAIGGSYGGSSSGTVTTPSTSGNPWSGALGGGLIGSQLGGNVGLGSGWGTLIGAGLGILGSR